MTLAPAFQQALPAFGDIPTHYNHEVNGELLYKLCAALAARGLGTPETWLKCGCDAIAFAKYSIMAAIGAERGELLQRNVEWNLEISDTFSDGYFTGEGEPLVGQGRLCVSISCSGCGYLKIGPALEALEREAAGLGAAFYWSLIRALYRVMRIYDHEDAMMYEEMVRENASHEDEGSLDQYEFPEVKKALPPCIQATLERKRDAADRQLLPSHIRGPYGPWIQRLRAMERLSRVRVTHCTELIEGNYDGPPLPSLILAFQEHDAVVACFDEESQGMLESGAEPTLCAVFSPDMPKEIDEAIRAISRFVAFNTELFSLAEQLVAWEEGHERENRDRGDPSLRAA